MTIAFAIVILLFLMFYIFLTHLHVSTKYDIANGNIVRTETPSNNEDERATYEIVKYDYDNMNRLVYTAISPSANETIYTQYNYDALGNPTRVVSGLTNLLDQTSPIPEDAWYVNYIYDKLGRLTNTQTTDGLSETYEYDYRNRLVKLIDKQNNATTYSYDNFDNITSVQSEDMCTNYTYNIVGMRTSMADSTGTTNYTYSPFGELTEEAKDGIIKSYSYDNLSNRTAFAVTNNGKQIINQTYTYNLLGKISKVTNGDDFVKYGYNADGYVASASFNDDSYMYIDYNYLNLPTLIKYENADGTISSTSYDYTLNGNLRMKSINSGESGSFYYYDDAGRLAIENTWGDNIDYDDIYTYDKLGNRLTSTHKDHITDQTVTTSYTYNNLNQLVSSACGDDTTTYSYDTLGNMTSVASNGITTKSYSYDDFGRLSQAGFTGHDEKSQIVL